VTTVREAVVIWFAALAGLASFVSIVGTPLQALLTVAALGFDCHYSVFMQYVAEEDVVTVLKLLQSDAVVVTGFRV